MRQPIFEFLRFCVVGVGNTLLNYGVFLFLLKVCHVPYVLSGGLGFISGAVLGFFLNRAWTFKSSHISSKYMLGYLAINVLSLFVNAGMQWLAVEHMMVPAVYSQFFGIVVTTMLNFVLSKILFTYANKAAGGN